MPDPNLTLQLLMQLDEAIQRIKWRFEDIQTPEDFTCNFSIDPQEVYKICSTDLQPLETALNQLRMEL
jgi:hypothetical protein